MTPLQVNAEHIWLGWDTPVLERAAAALLDLATPDELGALDISDWIIVTPGARAGRTLLSMLVQFAEHRQAPLLPPIFSTPGEIGTALLRTRGIPVGEFSESMLWQSALRSIDRTELSSLVRTAPDVDDRAGWSAIAKILAQHHRTLAGELLVFQDVAAQLTESAMPEEADRWRIAAIVQQKYIELVHEVGLVDQPIDLLETIRAGTQPRNQVPVALVGIAELARSARQAIAIGASRCIAMIASPEAESDHFDEIGCIIPDHWTERPLPIPESAIRVASEPNDGVSAALEAISEWDGKYAPSEIILGALESSTPGAFQRRAMLHDGLEVRDAAGLPLTYSPPVRILQLLSDLVEHRTYEALGAAIRQPDIARWVVRRLNQNIHEPSTRIGITRIISVLDTHRQTTLVSDIDQNTPPVPIDRVLAAFEVLLKATGFARGRNRTHTFAHWAERAARLLARIFFGRRLTTHNEADRLIGEACERTRSYADEARRLEQTDRGIIRTPIRISDAWRQIASDVGDGRSPLEASEDAIEMLGWLELALDPAPGVVVVGMNEEIVPSSRLADPLMPDSLRDQLGIACDRTRLARDRYLLEAILRARSPEASRFIVLKQDGEGSPLRPSRLLFHDSPSTVAARLVRLTDDDPDPQRETSVVPTITPGRADGFAMPRFPNTWEQVTRMSVTSFARYIRSPFGFYLERILRLNEVDDRIAEIDPMAFGTIIHDVLESFAHGDARDQVDPKQIEASLIDSLNSIVRERYGTHPRATVLVQAESARVRLRAFARKQADWRRQGWSIIEAEWRPENGAIDFDVEGAPMQISGTIDRIDRNEMTDAWALLDYKTGGAKSAKSAHRTRDGEWRDLQLPLYRHLAKAIIGDDIPTLGYVKLPRDLAETKFDLTDWDDSDLGSADNCARDIIRSVRAGEFHDLGDHPPDEGVLSWLCGVGFLSMKEISA